MEECIFCKIVNNELLFNRIDDEETKSIIDKLNNKETELYGEKDTGTNGI